MMYHSFLVRHDGRNWSWHRAFRRPLELFADVGARPIVFAEDDGELQVGLSGIVGAELVVWLAGECGVGSESFLGVDSLWPFVARDHAPCG